LYHSFFKDTSIKWGLQEFPKDIFNNISALRRKCDLSRLKKNILLLIVLIIPIHLFRCSYPGMVTEPVPVRVQYGKASYYGDEFHGRKTSNGEIYRREKLTAAHRTLPFGTLCRVTNRDNGKSVVVRINDRGPFKLDRIIDLSYKAAEMIGGIGPGIIHVKVEILKTGKNH
jgi:rare lipoprotein A